MNARFLIFMFISSLVIYSCKDGGNKTVSGYDFRYITKGSGETPKTGESVFFTLKIKDDKGEILQEIGEGPNMPVMQIPETFPTGMDANPVLELLSMVKVGDVVVLTMPIDSMPNPPANVQGMKYIEYELDIKNIKNKEEYEAYLTDMQKEMEIEREASRAKIPVIEELVANSLKDYKAGTLETKSTESGLKYYIIENGTGDNAVAGKTVKVQYYGSLIDGTRFDDSFNRGQAFEFKLGTGQVIPGWDEGLALLNKGSKAILFIPGNLAYGEQGSPPVIPANAELAFYVELEEIQ